jgi:hypothetical protein
MTRCILTLLFLLIPLSTYALDTVTVTLPPSTDCSKEDELAHKCKHEPKPKDEVSGVIFGEASDGEIVPGMGIEWNHMPMPGRGFETEAEFVHEDGQLLLDKFRTSFRTGNVQVGDIKVGTGVTFLKYDALLTGSFRMRFNFDFLGADTDFFLRLPELGQFKVDADPEKGITQQTEFYKGMTAILQRHGKICDLEMETRAGLPGAVGVFYYVEPEGTCGHKSLSDALAMGVFGSVEVQGYRLPGQDQFTQTRSIKLGISLFSNKER